MPKTMPARTQIRAKSTPRHPMDIILQSRLLARRCHVDHEREELHLPDRLGRAFPPSGLGQLRRSLTSVANRPAEPCGGLDRRRPCAGHVSISSSRSDLVSSIPISPTSSSPTGSGRHRRTLGAPARTPASPRDVAGTPVMAGHLAALIQDLSLYPAVGLPASRRSGTERPQ